MSLTLGEGSYGEVKIVGNSAVKTFHKMNHLIQEFMAMRYLDQCQHVVHHISLDINSLTLTMQLYDGSLRGWMSEQRSMQDKD